MRATMDAARRGIIPSLAASVIGNSWRIVSAKIMDRLRGLSKPVKRLIMDFTGRPTDL